MEGEHRSEYLKAVGDGIRRRREEMGMSQDELARLVDYASRVSVCQLESGKVDIPISKVMLLASALKTTPAGIVDVERPAAPAALSGSERALLAQIPALQDVLTSQAQKIDDLSAQVASLARPRNAADSVGASPTKNPGRVLGTAGVGVG